MIIRSKLVRLPVGPSLWASSSRGNLRVGDFDLRPHVGHIMARASASSTVDCRIDAVSKRFLKAFNYTYPADLPADMRQ